MDITDLSKKEILILCQLIDDDIRGGVTRDAGTILRYLRKYEPQFHFTKSDIHGLVGKFLRVSPKKDDKVYSIKRTPENKKILDLLEGNTKEYIESIVHSGEERKPNFHPGLLGQILPVVENQKNVRLLNISEADEEDIVGDETYKKACVTLAIICPRTKKEFEQDIVLGVLDVHKINTYYCPKCGHEYKLQGVRFIGPK